MVPDHIDRDMSKTTPSRLKHLRCPETASPSTNASLERTDRNHKGLNQWNLGAGWPAECNILPQSPEWLQQCGHLCRYGGAAGYRYPCLDGVCSTPQRPWEERCWSTTWRWPSSFPEAGYRPLDQFWWRRPQFSIWKCFMISWISQKGSQWKKARLKIAVWFPGHTGMEVLSLVTMSKTRSDLPPSNFWSMWRHHSALPFSLVSWWGTQLAQCFYTSSLSSIPYPRGSLGHHRWFCNKFSPLFPVFHFPLGLAELQACPFPDVVFPPLPLSALSSSPFYYALQNGFGQT